ncbi:unnamed protein product [Cladocopium goreaui]|uniref:E3 ubiquitin-protein ligase HERC2 n=1 Tax=Cladocopium goreaui TaxID=2562237 RepID=A0A9P1GBH4_9DINO|nr:unnamed protein product [Cladocopium goreaui]
MLIEEGDETALAIQEFEDQVIHVCQDSPELAMAFSTYQEARQKLRDKFRSRGFWSLRHGKGKGKNKSKKGKGPRKYQSLAERIASSTCRACGARGHWKDECPLKDKNVTADANVILTEELSGGGELLDELPGHDLANWQNQIGFKVSPLFLKLTAMTLPSASGTPFPGLQTEMLDAMLSGEVDASLAFEDRQLPEIKSRRPPGVMTLKEWGQLKFPEGKWRHKSFFQAYQEDPKYGKFMKEHRKLVSAWALSFQAYVEAMDRMQEDCSKAFYQEYARQWAKAEMSKTYPKAEIEKSQGPEWELLTGGVTSRPMSTMSSPSQKRPMEEEQSQMAIEVQQKEEMITRMAILQREMDKIKADLEGQAALWKVLEEERPREVWMAPECKYWGNFSRRNMGRYHCKQTPAGDHGCAAGEYWDGIFKKIETMVPRVGKRVLDDDGVLAQIQKGAPNLKVQRVEACRGTERLRLPGADADPETIPLRLTVVKDRITGQSMVLGPAEEWAALPKRQQIRKGQSAKMSLTIFGSFPKSGELETMGSDKEAGMRNLIWFKELWIISATVVRKQKLVQRGANLRRDRGRWYGPASVVAVEGSKNVWLNHAGKLVRTSPEQLRAASFREWKQAKELLTESGPGNSDLQRALNDGSFIDVDGEDFPDWEAETEGYDPSIGEPEGELSVQPPGTPNGELSNQSEPPQGVEQSENELPDYVRVPVPESVSESDGDASQAGVNLEPTDDLLFGDDITMSADDRCCQFWEIEIPVENHEEHALFCAGSADESVLLVTGAKKKRVEVRLSDLSSADQQRMAVAKHKEIGAWLKHGTVRKASKGKNPEEAIMRCRWLLTWKSASPEDHPKDVSEGRKAKARLIVVGYEDPGVGVVQNDSPTLTKDGRQMVVQQVSSHGWELVSFDVSTAFLQGEGDGRLLGLYPTPELTEALGLEPGDQCQLVGKEKYAHQGGLIFVTTPELLENKRSVVAPVVYHLHLGRNYWFTSSGGQRCGLSHWWEKQQRRCCWWLLLKRGNVQKLQAIKKTAAWASDSFALLRCDGTVSTWGEPTEGGNSSSAQDRLQHIVDVVGSQSAFTALRSDGEIVTWGHKDFGSALGGHKDFLKDVTEIVASGRAFAAILKDGTVISWGDKKYGGDCSAVKDRLKDVRSLAASFSAFAAICGGGHVVSWGNEASGGSCENVKDELVNVRQLSATDAAFAALLADGKVVTWGADGDGGKSENLEKVQEISGTSKAFAAILTDGTVRTWGDPSKGGDCSLVQEKLKHVQRLYPSGRGFAALLSDGHVVSWGEVSDTRGVEDELLDIRYIASSYGAFLALRGDGTVVSWGDQNYGANTNRLKGELSNVQIISGASEGFAAIRADGRIICWDRIGQVDLKVHA